MTHFKHTKLSALGALCCLAVTVSALAGTASAAPARSGAATAVCSTVASGAHWRYKGQQGTKYSIVAVNGSRALCATAATWPGRGSGLRGSRMPSCPAGARREPGWLLRLRPFGHPSAAARSLRAAAAGSSASCCQRR